MDYIRKKRNITYHSAACKMYLRHDFRHTCAYCGEIEEALFLSPLVADAGFEKDHFVPQHADGMIQLDTPELHAYPNMFYACSKCNGLKDNIILPLNPCRDSIYSGDNPHIVGGNESEGFILDYNSPQGKEYIEKLDLNSRHHIEIRREQDAWKKTKGQTRQILQNLKAEGGIELSLIEQLERIVFPEINDEYLSYCGGSNYGLSIKNVCCFLSGKGYSIEILFEECELDVKIAINGITYLAKMSPLNGAEQCRVKTAVLAEWKKYNMPCGILRFEESPMKIRLYPVDFDRVLWEKTEYRIDEYCEL